jgi:GTP1/Obg family GTP-binding protein
VTIPTIHKKELEMSNLNDFYKMLTVVSEGKNAYRDTLAAITKSTRPELRALSNDLSWQTWDAEGKPENV